MEGEDVDKLTGLDSKLFGSSRIRVLKKLFEDYPPHCFVADHGLKVVGYIMARKIQDAYWIGPWVCEDSDVSRRLLETCMRSIQGKDIELRIGFPSPNEVVSTLAQKEGFKFTGRSRRMVFGPRRYHGIPQGVYGIAGPEKG